MNLQGLLEKFPSLTLLVVGDFFLDQYLDLDAELTEPSLETGLDAYQISGVRSYPGAAGTVTNNLRALGVKVIALGVIGDDGRGYELKRALRATGVDGSMLLERADRFTPTYTKPMLATKGAARELNRLDLINRAPLTRDAEAEIIARLQTLVPRVGGVIGVDQVAGADCGVLTARVREALANLAGQQRNKIFAVESRANINSFRNVILKPNAREVARAFDFDEADTARVHSGVEQLFAQTRRAVFLTRGENGILVRDGDGFAEIPTLRVAGPIDIVGAGDSALAGIVAALCAGASSRDAALVGNLAASVTIRQIGTTGTASRAQILDAYREWQAQREQKNATPSNGVAF